MKYGKKYKKTLITDKNVSTAKGKYLINKKKSGQALGKEIGVQWLK